MPRYYRVPRTFTHKPRQLRPVAVHASDDVTAVDFPATVHGAGTVTYVQNEERSFQMSPAQYVSSGYGELSIRGWLRDDPARPDFINVLPAEHSLISFRGTLQTVDVSARAVGEEIAHTIVVRVNTIAHVECKRDGGSNAQMCEC